jgi:hypothetical protein
VVRQWAPEPPLAKPPCYCFCILGDPAERLKGIREQEEGGYVVRGAGGRMSMVGPSELFDRSGTSTRSERRRCRQWRVALSVRMLLSIKGRRDPLRARRLKRQTWGFFAIRPFLMCRADAAARFPANETPQNAVASRHRDKTHYVPHSSHHAVPDSTHLKCNATQRFS